MSPTESESGQLAKYIQSLCFCLFCIIQSMALNYTSFTVNLGLKNNDSIFLMNDTKERTVLGRYKLGTIPASNSMFLACMCHKNQ